MSLASPVGPRGLLGCGLSVSDLWAACVRVPQVTKSMSKKKILKRSRIKPFVKYVNYNHIMPTRYSVDIDVKSVVTPAAMKKVDTRVEARKNIKNLFQQRYIERGKNTTGVQYFFRKLRF